MSVVLYLSFVVSSEARQLCPLELTTLVIQSGDIHTSCGVSVFSAFSYPNVCHHQCEGIPFGWAHLPPLSVCLSLSLSLILSLSYGGRDENGCLIMQRGQQIKAPGPSDLRAYSEHSWREKEMRGKERGWRQAKRERERQVGV